MCFGGTVKQADVPTIVTVPSPADTTTSSPSPTIVAPTESPALTAEARRKKLEALRYGGMQSTIKTSPQGVTGPAPVLAVPAASGTTKTKLGQ